MTKYYLAIDTGPRYIAIIAAFEPDRYSARYIDSDLVNGSIRWSTSTYKPYGGIDLWLDVNTLTPKNDRKRTWYQITESQFNCIDNLTR